MQKKFLQLNLIRKYFDKIASGDKVIEYRDYTPYWHRRIANRHYTHIRFRNGYAKVAPIMEIVYRGYKVVERKGRRSYALDLGEIISVYNYNPSTSKNI